MSAIELVTPVRFEITEEAISLKREHYAALSADSAKGYEQVRLAIADCRNMRVAIEAKRKELKADALEYGRMVDSAAKTLTGLIEELEEPLKLKKAAVDDEKARIKREKEEAERARIEAELQAKREAEEAERRAVREAEERALAAERARIEAEQRALAEEKAKLDAERKRLEAEELARREAEEARIREAREREDAARRERERAEQERLRIEREKLEAERREVEESRRKAEREEFERQVKIRAEAEAREAAIRETEERKRAEERLLALAPDREKALVLARRLRDLLAENLGMSTDEGREVLANARHDVKLAVEILEDFATEAIKGAA